ncbi:RELT-like protein 1 [Sphaerodactylus townsendi]|uniref:RELT-like protein 1 n=1 Tax=Sphaerodactylus townsendi TaxID=933632 RepID=UPI002026C843|nr:RELT-like protein 1 [Sphaerodactylus townsendi]
MPSPRVATPPAYSGASLGSAASAWPHGNQDFPMARSHNLNSVTNKPPTDGSDHTHYIAYALIPVCFLMGLLGVLICHILKRQGYRCTTEAEQEEEKLGEKIELNESTNDNGDTVGQIVNYIMKNEANADVLKAMVADSGYPESPTTPGSPTSPSSPLSPGGPPSKHSCHDHHLHTIGGVAGKGVCTRCRHKRWQLFSPTKKSKEARRARHKEVTVLSVGRFRVTKVEQKSSKERKNLMSVSSIDSVKGEMPATPVKGGSEEVPTTPVARQDSKELHFISAKKEARDLAPNNT